MAGNFALSFSLNFLSIFVQYLRLHYAEHSDLGIIGKIFSSCSIFGQNWWRQKWKKGQGSSGSYTTRKGDKGLMLAVWRSIAEVFPTVRSRVKFIQKVSVRRKTETENWTLQSTHEELSSITHWGLLQLNAILNGTILKYSNQVDIRIFIVELKSHYWLRI